MSIQTFLLLQCVLCFSFSAKAWKFDGANVEEECFDTPGWNDAMGKTCDWYARSHVCSNGRIAEHWEAGKGFAPDLNCCVCGGGGGTHHPAWQAEAYQNSVTHETLVCNGPGMCSPSIHRSLEEQYLYTVRQSLTGVLLATPSAFPDGIFNATLRLIGLDRPIYGMTMVGVMRIELLHELLRKAYLGKQLKGGFLEAGVWRGGNCIYAKAFMRAYNLDYPVWVVDSFQGLPKKEHARDLDYWYGDLSVSLPAVQDHFKRYGLFDSSVKFVPGFFGDSLPIARQGISAIAILRLDGDMYKSTLEILCNLYDKLLVGGYWIVDDWGLDPPIAKHAVLDFKRANHIPDRHVHIGDEMGVWFEKRLDKAVNRSWCESVLYAIVRRDTK